jgi:hypothetical protein
VAKKEDRSNAYRILVGKPLRKRSLGNARIRKDAINIDINEMVCEDGRCMQVAQFLTRRWASV